MDTQQTITFIQNQMTLGKISKEDLVNLIGSTTPISTTSSSTSVAPIKEVNSKNLIHIFYGIGALIALIGVCTLVAQNWEYLGFSGRIIVTLGISLVTYAGGLGMMGAEHRVLSQVMFTLSAALAPIGAWVFIDKANLGFGWTQQLITAIVLTIVFGTAWYISKRNILVLVTVGFASWFYYAFIFKLFESSYYDSGILKFASILLGASYICIAYSFTSSESNLDDYDRKEKIAVKNLLYGLGALGVLGAGISIGGIFDLLFIAVIFGAFYGSVYLKSRAMLIFSALFLIGHMIKLTSKYFVDSIGWPIALIISGFAVIGVGYMTYYLNKKYISSR
jgi:hypothetical protein